VRLDEHYGFFATLRSRGQTAWAILILYGLCSLLYGPPQRKIPHVKGNAKEMRNRRMRTAISLRSGRETLLIYFIILLGFSFWLSEAVAHSRLVRSDPPARAVLDTAPKELKLWFNEAVEPSFAKFWIVPAQGDQIPLTSRGDTTDKRILIVTLPNNLPAGPVNIGYHVLSVDGHTVDDKLTFTVKAPA
jgi:methionine-rich copper-binding protein CopC